jgi:hypothetical protein
MIERIDQEPKPMIVSHSHRFIFLKTAKTAGTSVEAALRPHCGPDDIMTKAVPPVVFDGRKALTHNEKRGLTRLGIYVPGGLRRHLPQIAGFYPHMPGRQVRAMIGRDVWDSYFKFSVERNPWDRQVSLFYYRHRRRDPKLEFERYLTGWYSWLHSNRIDNWDVYTIGGSIAADRVLRFENLREDFAEVCRMLGIDASLPHVNRGPARDHSDYRDFYTPRSRDIVARWYRNEIEAFGYEF